MTQPVIVIHDQSLNLYYLDDGEKLTAPEFRRWVQEHPEVEPIIYSRRCNNE
jgi:hypothetical protein